MVELVNTDNENNPVIVEQYQVGNMLNETVYAVSCPLHFTTKEGIEIHVPRGFISYPLTTKLFTDKLLSLDGKYGPALVIHDYLYRLGYMSEHNPGNMIENTLKEIKRSDADNILVEMLITLGMNRLFATIMSNIVSRLRQKQKVYQDLHLRVVLDHICSQLRLSSNYTESADSYRKMYLDHNACVTLYKYVRNELKMEHDD